MGGVRGEEGCRHRPPRMLCPQAAAPRGPLGLGQATVAERQPHPSARLPGPRFKPPHLPPPPARPLRQANKRVAHFSANMRPEKLQQLRQSILQHKQADLAATNA